MEAAAAVDMAHVPAATDGGNLEEIFPMAVDADGVHGLLAMGRAPPSLQRQQLRKLEECEN